MNCREPGSISSFKHTELPILRLIKGGARAGRKGGYRVEQRGILGFRGFPPRTLARGAVEAQDDLDVAVGVLRDHGDGVGGAEAQDVEGAVVCGRWASIMIREPSAANQHMTATRSGGVFRSILGAHKHSKKNSDEAQGSCTEGSCRAGIMCITRVITSVLGFAFGLFFGLL